MGQVAMGSNGGTATAQFQGSIGTLNAYSCAAFPYGYDAQGHGLQNLVLHAGRPFEALLRTQQWERWRTSGVAPEARLAAPHRTAGTCLYMR